jgi:protein-tyrosine phosphatase
LDPAEVVEGSLWYGSSPSYDELVALRARLGSSLAIVDLTRNRDEQESCKKLGITYDERTPSIEESYAPVPLSKLKLVSQIVDDNIQSGRKVLLHCTAGLGRSPTCAAAYLVHCGLSLAEAKERVSRDRPVWKGRDAVYAGSLEEFAKIQELTRSTF